MSSVHTQLLNNTFIKHMKSLMTCWWETWNQYKYVHDICVMYQSHWTYSGTTKNSKDMIFICNQQLNTCSWNIWSECTYVHDIQNVGKHMFRIHIKLVKYVHDIHNAGTLVQDTHSVGKHMFMINITLVNICSWYT